MAPRLQIRAIFAKLQIIEHQTIAQSEKKRSAITGKKRSNMGGFARWNGWNNKVKWLRLRCKTTEIAMQNRWNGNAKRWKWYSKERETRKRPAHSCNEIPGFLLFYFYFNSPRSVKNRERIFTKRPSSSSLSRLVYHHIASANKRVCIEKKMETDF